MFPIRRKRTMFRPLRGDDTELPPRRMQIDTDRPPDARVMRPGEGVAPAASPMMPRPFLTRNHPMSCGGDGQARSQRPEHGPAPTAPVANAHPVSRVTGLITRTRGDRALCAPAPPSRFCPASRRRFPAFTQEHDEERDEKTTGNTEGNMTGNAAEEPACMPGGTGRGGLSALEQAGDDASHMRARPANRRPTPAATADQNARICGRISRSSSGAFHHSRRP